MNAHRKKMKLTWLAMLVSIVPGSFASAQGIDTEAEKFFEARIRPVLVRECYGCHSSKSQVKGGLWLDTREGSQAGGDSGPAVVPGDLEESLLWNAINHVDFNMPPGKDLSQDIIADFKEWIEMGAPDPRSQVIHKVNSTITPADIEKGKEFWSFRKPVKNKVPENDESKWAKTDIDYFVLAKLNEHGLEPSPDTDPNTFLRRLSFDLIGLPPSPQQVSWFEKQWKKDPDQAVEKVVDALLARPEFGERWGRHWLDVSRYAESTGKEQNLTYPHAWRYRDYVIDSFNEDKPYDRFIQEQIAGDLLPVKADEQWAENLVATGFLAMGPKTLTEQNGRQFELDLIDEQIDVTTRVVLGVSVACARCHDHKFDPIPQSDYYALSGIFKSMTTHYGTMDTFQNRRPSNLLILPIEDLSYFDEDISENELASLKKQLDEKRRELNDLRRQRRQARTGSNPSNPQQFIAKFGRLSAEVGSLESRINSYDENGHPYTYGMGVQTTDRPVNARLLVRGEFDKPSEEIPRGFPQVISDEPVVIDRDSSGRLELARWMTDESNPLTARVMVNRIWLHMFGNGIVKTPENFGATGQLPTHPELLDYLAVEFMENEWSIKNVIREIAISRVYRSSSDFDKRSFETDPENKYVWRVEPRRLDAEVIRDSILKISGELDSTRPRASLVAKIGTALVRDGNLVSPGALSSIANMRMGMNENTDRPRSRMRGRRRQFAEQLRSAITVIDQPVKYRSVYLPIIRDNVPRALDVFDFAESSMVIGKRESSNTPDQGLYFLNNDLVIEQSDAMARRLMRESDDVREQIKMAFLLAFGRGPTAKELKAVEKFYREFESSISPEYRDRYRNDEMKRLSAICQAMMASAEFRFVN